MVPRDLGFITKKSNPYKVDIADRYLRTDYVAALCQGIRVGDLIQELNLRNASLATEGAIQILNAMQYKNIKSLDFSSNRNIQEGFFEQLGGMFVKSDFKLEVLHLENIDINESTAEKFLQDVTDSRTLKVLNLSRNNLSDASAGPICDVIDRCQSLDALYLHYNKIFGKGGRQIAEVLEQNGNLQILDLSFNALNGGIVTKD
jgi:NLR family CARD domain-containing protein 3